MTYDDFDSEPYIPSDAQKLHRFETTVKEIAFLITSHIKTGNPELTILEDGLQQKYVISIDSKKMFEFDIEGFKFFFDREKRKNTGSWSDFLEGTVESIAEYVFLEELERIGYEIKPIRK